MKFKTSVPLKGRYTKTLSGFRGVDLTSSPLDVSPSRASEAYNLIIENGVNRKRNGWEGLFELNDRVNGIFPFDEGDTQVLLVHAGTYLWRVVKGADGAYTKTSLNGAIQLTDTPSQCFYQNGMAFLVGCGTYLVYGKHGAASEYTLKPVSEIAYVPTTSYVYQAEYKDGDTNNSTSYSAESVNLLTTRRKHKIYVESVKKKTHIYCADGLTNFKVTVYPLKIGEKASTLTFKSNGDLTSEVTIKMYDVVANYDFAVTFKKSGHVITVSAEESKGAINQAIDYIIIEVDKSTNSHLLNRCNFGTLFGVDGASDRLFLSGNPSERNKDFFSEAGDFTYFPDGNVLTVGGSDAAITGYARLSDATLAIFKEEAMGSPSIFYRTGKETKVTDADGVDVPVPLFPTVPGTTGEHLMRAGAVANLSGDVLFLSKGGVFGIELSANISSTERYAVERSRAIYEDLRRRDLSNAVCTVFRSRYYLALGDEEGTCYVADAHYRASFEGADTGYEWWVWKNIPATCFAVFEDRLIFGTANGLVCGFHNGFVDRYNTDSAAGDVKQSGEGCTFSAEIGVKVGDEVVLGEGFYGLLIENCCMEKGVIRIKEEDLKLLTERLYVGAKVYVDNTGDSELQVGVQYTVISLSAGALTLTLGDDKGTKTDVSCEGFRLSMPLAEVTCRIGEMDGACATLCDMEGAPYRLVTYNGNEATVVITKHLHRSPVVATFTSPVMDLGSNMHRKSLLGMSVVLGTYSEGEVRFGIETRNTALDLAARGVDLLDFEKLDFDNFSFAMNRFTKSYTKRLNKRNINYARVTYRSEGEEDCAIESITLYYKINQMNRGLY